MKRSCSPEKGLTGNEKAVIRTAPSEIHVMTRSIVSRTGWWWQYFIGGVCPTSV
jgi:hypothetical protein